MRGENSEIDLVDVSLFLIRKWLSIMIATFIFVAIGYVFVSVQHDTKVVSITNLIWIRLLPMRYVAILMIFNVKQRLSLTSLAVSCLRTIKIK